MKSENKWNFLSVLKEKRSTIPKKERKERTRMVALEYINYEGINTLPIKLENIDSLFDEYEWIVISYDEAKRLLKVKDPLNIKKKNAVARTLHQRDSDVFLTVYVKNLDYPKRDNYTIAHELGHIILGHFFEFQNTSLFRGGLTKKEYGVLEREAEIFAAEFLMPMPVLKKIDLKSFEDIVKLCEVTKTPAKIRMTEIKNFKLTNITTLPYLSVKTQFSDFINKKNCLQCGHAYISKDAKLCPICGSKLIWGDGKMQYSDGHELDPNGKAIFCPRCGNEDHFFNGDYCKICGAYLINKCTNEPSYDYHNNLIEEGCQAYADGNARFCVLCGSQTTFFRDGLLEPWDLAKEKIEQAAVSIENKNFSLFDDDDDDPPF